MIRDDHDDKIMRCSLFNCNYASGKERSLRSLRRRSYPTRAFISNVTAPNEDRITYTRRIGQTIPRKKTDLDARNTTLKALSHSSRPCRRSSRSVTIELTLYLVLVLRRNLFCQVRQPRRDRNCTSFRVILTRRSNEILSNSKDLN